MIRTDTTPHHITASALVGGPRLVREVRGNTRSMPALLAHSTERVFDGAWPRCYTGLQETVGARWERGVRT